jgi:hypothetical protein
VDDGTDNRDGSPPRAASVPDGASVKRIERDAAGHLVLHLKDSDDPVNDVQLTRYFPWSMPEAYVAIRDSDGREVVMLRTLDELDPASRKIAEAELRDKVFNPKIHRVLDYKHEFGISSITAETDRGVVIFQFRGRRDIRQLSPTRALFRDVDGNTYELSDFSRLDPISQKYLHGYF